MPGRLTSRDSRTPAHAPVSPELVAGGLALLAAIFVLVLLRKRAKSYLRPGGARGRRKSAWRIRPGGTATEKQLEYLRTLIEVNNSFRGQPVSFESWLRLRAGGEKLSKKYASELIQALKAENEDWNRTFEAMKGREGVGRFRGVIRATDLGALAFCERAAYFSVHQYPNQNLAELSAGQEIHRAYSDAGGRDSGRRARSVEFLRSQLPSVTRVEWLPESAEAILRHPSLPVSVRPDGYVHFSDGTKALLELKSAAKLPDSPKSAHVAQLEAYAVVVSAFSKLRDEGFLLYRERGTSALSVHKVPLVKTDYDLARDVAKIERGVRAMDELKPSTSARKCGACGFRSICSARLSG